MGLTPELQAQQGTVDRDALLGVVLWYSVPTATCLDPKVVTKELASRGFTRKIPNVPAEADVFRRVIAKAERTKVPVEGDDTKFENWMIRPTNARTETAIAKRIVCETVDPKGRRLEYEQVVDIEFTPPLQGAEHGVLKVSWIPGHTANVARAQEIVQEVKDGFEQWKGMFHDAIMRNWIKQTILGMGATAVRPTGGIYFLRAEHSAKVEALESFITAHFPPGGECHSIEIPDTRKQREMVRRAIEAETVGAIEGMMVEIAKVKAEGGLTVKKFTAMKADVKKLEAKCSDYSALLSADLSAIQARIELLAGMTKGLGSLSMKGK